MRHAVPSLLLLLGLFGCQDRQGTEPPPRGWTNTAPTIVEQAVDRQETQLLKVLEGTTTSWVQVPAVQAKAGDHVLLGPGSAAPDVELPEVGERASGVLQVAHVQVVDLETAQRTVTAPAPHDAVTVATVYAELDQREGQDIVVYGTVVKVTRAMGAIWVHLQDGTGHPSKGNFDLTLQTQQPVTQGHRAAFRGVLRKDVSLGFGYHYDALIEDAGLVE